MYLMQKLSKRQALEAVRSTARTALPTRRHPTTCSIWLYHLIITYLTLLSPTLPWLDVYRAPCMEVTHTAS